MVIIVLVELTVMLPALVMLARGESKRVASYDAGFPTHEYLGVTLGVDDGQEETLTPETRAALDAPIKTLLEARGVGDPHPALPEVDLRLLARRGLKAHGRAPDAPPLAAAT